MKKVSFVLIILTGMFFINGKVQAQAPATALKIGVFDIGLMVQAMPGYGNVDSLTQMYERDSLNSEYEIYQNEYRRLDSTFKSDSAAGKSKTILEYTNNQRQQMAFNLIYWQQIAQNKSDNKRAMLAQPLYEKVAAAYKKVLDSKKYTLVLKPNTYELGSSSVENLFPLVAKELNVTLPVELGGQDTSAGAKPPGQ